RVDSLKSYILEGKATVLGSIVCKELVGFIWFFEKDIGDHKVIHINHFVVKENKQGLGIGTSLWNEVERYANDKKIIDIELFVTKTNETAVDFYKKRNFEVERLYMKKRL
ncbi:GNAT family N-acetyltransferase, partial [Alkalibacillus haloalkaliphilus]|uniref:GNAT family N-acetyltransferase n=1 Tax=Alkalibacillus haloalkaliphilus TaxID=94136 RepID=UPI000367A2A6